MVLSLKDKQIIVTEINKIAKDASSAIVADFCGTTVNQITKLRKLCRESNVYVRIIRNTLIHRIVVDTAFACLKNMLSGPTLIAFSTEHPNVAARIFRDFAKNNVKFNIKIAIFEGKIISGSQIDNLANLPTYNEAIISLILVVKEVFAGKLIRSLIMLKNKK